MAVHEGTAGMSAARVRRRAVFHIGGYDPKSADAFFDRLEKEARRFEANWGVEVERVGARPASGASGGEAPAARDIARRDYITRSPGEGWTTRTTVHQLTLDDIVLDGFAWPAHRRILRYLRAFADYWTCGVSVALLRRAWRFWLYFVYPFAVLLAGGALVAFLAAFGWAVWPPLALAFGALAIWWVGARLLRFSHALHLMDLWSFSSDYLHAREPRAEAKLDRLGAAIAEALDDPANGEVLVVGHSTGGALALDAAARAVGRTVGGACTDRLSVMTVGSTALKIGLHPAAGWFRERVGRLAAGGVRWFEFQALSDVINLYRTNPAALMGLAADAVQVRTVRLSRAVAPDVWRRMRRNFFRVHYQFVFANTRRLPYDYFAALFGPLSMAARDAAVPASLERLDGERHSEAA